MLSRRNIRIKVMQVLYAMNRDKAMDLKDGIALYNEYLDRSFNLLAFHLVYLSETAAFALVDEERRKAKHLPDQFDKTFKPTLATNCCTRCILDNEEFQKLVMKRKGGNWVDNDEVRRNYYDFVKSDAYKKYLSKTDYSDSDHVEILLTLFKHLIGSEGYVESVDSHFPNWPDDKSLIIGAIKKIVKSLPENNRFYADCLPQTETTKGFGEKLLNKVVLEETFLLDLIKPTLKNWDADRVAVLDMILLKMAITELMTFSTIPTKVTLNEFLEVSKTYSTAKSKDFINGILDRLMKQLSKQGMIKKEGRGLVE